jgi:beta-lactamase regulating signal transducer with metallopeptidase domain
MNPWETLSEIVRTLLIMSATGSMVVLLLFVLKPIIKNHLPKSTQYYLWVLVLVAFLVPFSVFVSLPFATPMAPLQEVLDENVKTTMERREELSQERYGMEYGGVGCARTDRYFIP